MRRGLFFTITLCILFIGSAFAQIQSGVLENGTQEHPFLIEDRQELLDFHRCMLPGNTFYHNGTTFVTTGGGQAIENGAANTYFKLTTDVVINEGNVSGSDGEMEDGWLPWRPMVSFQGHFDGDFHTISGLFYDTLGPKVGFFEEITGSATVTNLGIVNSFFRGTANLGGIAGVALDATVSHCFFEGTLECNGTGTGDYVGGISGTMEGTTIISDCYTTGSIYATNEAAIIHGNSHGGIVGYIWANASGSINHCYTTMTIQGVSDFIGAIYGREGDGVTATVNSCFFDKQMFNGESITGHVTGMLTTEMTNTSWNALGDAFVWTKPNMYPHLRGFDYDNNPAVRLSVMPIFLPVTSPTNYVTVENLNQNFTLNALPGVTYSVDSWNDAISVSGTTATLERQGVASLIASAGGLSRTFVLYPNVAPLLGTSENPFLIENLEHLKTFRNGINKGTNFLFRRMPVNSSNLASIHWRQVEDIDMSSVNPWTPIGSNNSEAIPFKGYYHGGGHTLSMLSVSGSQKYAGLFGYMQNGLFISPISPFRTLKKNVSLPIINCGWERDCLQLNISNVILK